MARRLAVFRGICAAASLKHRHHACNSVVVCAVFRGICATASLKRPEQRRKFPYSIVFRGMCAAASLKRGIDQGLADPGEGGLPQHVRAH
jgi:hypothetical protein